MKFPKKIRVTSRATYKIIWVNRFLSDHEQSGECSPSPRRIYIRLGLSERERWYTLLHELLHAIEFEYGCDLGHPKINMLEKALYRILRLNKHLKN